jgi:hypothetical protein
MLKDILLNIDVDDAGHRTADFAVSIARTFDMPISPVSPMRTM